MYSMRKMMILLFVIIMTHCLRDSGNKKYFYNISSFINYLSTLKYVKHCCYIMQVISEFYCYRKCRNLTVIKIIVISLLKCCPVKYIKLKIL